MFPRLAPLLVSLVIVACAPLPTTIPTARHDPLDAYASAVEESVSRYENEVVVATRVARTLAPSRYEQLLAAALRRRGLTLDRFRALARTAPRFYATQEALYAVRLDDAQLAATDTAPRVTHRAP